MNKRIYKDEDQLCADIFESIKSRYEVNKKFNTVFYTTDVRCANVVFHKLFEFIDDNFDRLDVQNFIENSRDDSYYFAKRENDYCINPVIQINCYYNEFINCVVLLMDIYNKNEDYIVINPTIIFADDTIHDSFVKNFVLDKDMDKIIIYSIDPDLYEKEINHKDDKVHAENCQHKSSFESINKDIGTIGGWVIDDITKSNMYGKVNGDLLCSWKPGVNTFDYSKQEERAEENEMNSCECSDCSEKIIHSEEMVVDDLKYLSYSYIDENREYKTINCSTNDDNFIYHFMEYIHEIINSKRERERECSD